MGTQTRHEPTPAEEAFFKRHPKLGKAMEELRDEEAWRRMEKHELKAELHREEARRILDNLMRELGI